MKAYVVEYKGSDWCDFTHAVTSQDARVLFWRTWSAEGEFVDIRARRVQELDDIALSGINIHNAGGYDADWIYGNGTSTCHCGTCKSRFDVKAQQPKEAK